jgi:hypothetical protein
MLEWLKKKAVASQLKQQFVSLHEHFALLKKVPAELTERLATFVLTGEDQAAVSDVAAHGGHVGQWIVYGPIQKEHAASFSSLLDSLPQDPEVYLRLARVYEAGYLFRSSIPAYRDAHTWLGTFLIMLHQLKSGQTFPASLIEAMVAAKQEDPSVLVRGAFLFEDAQGKNLNNRWLEPPCNYYRRLSGFPDIALRYPGVVRQGLQQKDAHNRACALQALDTLRIPLDVFLEDIAALAVSGSKEVREVADRLMALEPLRSQPLLERRTESGSSDERYHAIRALAKLCGDAARDFLRQRLEHEKSAKVIELLHQCLDDTRPADAGGSERAGSQCSLPPVPEVAVHAPLDRQVLEDLKVCLAKYDSLAAAEHEKHKNRPYARKERNPLPGNAAARIFHALQDFTIPDDMSWNFFPEIWWGEPVRELQRFAAHPKFDLIHLVRWCVFLVVHNQRKVLEGSFLTHAWQESFMAYQKARRQGIDLRQLAAVFRAIGLDDYIIARRMLEDGRFSTFPVWRSNPEAIWPYFAERIDLFEQTLGLKPPDEQRGSQFLDGERRTNAFKLLSLFPQLPAALVPSLWDFALGAGKTDRPLAQQSLARVPDKEKKIVATLASRQQPARAAAAEWLAELKYKNAISPLRSALAKEKSEPVKDEMMRALEALGVPLEELLDRDRLDQEAEKGLAKGFPKDLEWVPLAQLPAVHWADNGKQVSLPILHWFLVQGCKLKNAEAGPTLRRYASLMVPQEREALGRFVLEAWIAKDTKPKYTAEEAAKEAAAQTRQIAAFAKQSPKYYPDFDEQKFQQAAFSRLLIHPEGSAIDSKGILAVAGACCGADAASIVHRYVKQWYGYRPAQCKALLQMLAWVDHPTAVQVILSVANRFRTKGIQEEAMRQSQLLAERKGWILDELSDRTIPTAGLDEDGTMELDYGSRKFIARLAEDMSLVLTNEAGETISSLPDANKADDQELVKQSKAMLSSAKKELKTVLSMQKERLYEALCTQRTWRFEEWDNYLLKHPIVGRYCQRLVWTAVEQDKVARSFRALPDGTLTDVQDEAVILAAEAMVRLAHDVTLPEADAKAWLQHFVDYVVEPLFQQFGKPVFVLPEQMREATEIGDFEGHVLKAFSLRNRLTRVGYTRGAAQDGGWFFDYHKTFPRLGIEAVVEFTGNSLPEENRTVALLKLRFAPKGGPGAIDGQLTFSDLPPVLLTECWNDIRLAAAEGSGFAPDWQKQTEM